MNQNGMKCLSGPVVGKRKGEMKSPFADRKRKREREYFDEKLQPGCKISNQKRNCKVELLTMAKRSLIKPEF